MANSTPVLILRVPLKAAGFPTRTGTWQFRRVGHESGEQEMKTKILFFVEENI